MDYDSALADFQNKNYQNLISSVQGFMSNKWDTDFHSPEIIKLLDISLRAALMCQDHLAFENIISRCGHTSALSHFKAAKYFNDGNDELAWSALSNASSYNIAHHGFWSLGLNSLVRNRDWHSLYLDQKHSIANKISDSVPHKYYDDNVFVGKKYVIAFSSDAAYFKRFFSYSLSSLRENCQDYLAVYHVINPDDECLQLMRSSSGGDVCFSSEVRKITSVEKSYYASKRFFIANDVITRSGLPAFILDIDTCLKKDLLSLFIGDGRDVWAPEKIGLKLSPAMELPWQKIAAGSVYLPPNEEGRIFISRACDFLDHVYSRTGPHELWWIDQNALFFSYLNSDPELFQRWTGVLLNTYLSYPKLFDDKDKFFKDKQTTVQ